MYAFLSTNRKPTLLRLRTTTSTDAREIKTWSSDEATGMTTPKSCAYAQNHAAELLTRPEELGLRPGPRSRAARETRTGVEGETTQGRPTELQTKPRRPREAAQPVEPLNISDDAHLR